eukprot:scaffold44155_cov75-Phaeocystis_antarctica.AAC.1
MQAHNRPGDGHNHVLHATDDPSQIAPSLRCLGVPPPESTVMARAVAARAALRSYQPRLHDGATGGGGSRRIGAVERAFRTGLTALGSQGCMRAGAAATPAVVLKGGDRAVWPVGAEQSTDVRAPATSAAVSPHPPSRPHAPISYLSYKPLSYNLTLRRWTFF